MLTRRLRWHWSMSSPTRTPRRAASEALSGHLELLDAGIDVFTTLNVQHLEPQPRRCARSRGNHPRDGAGHGARRARNSNWSTCRPTNCAPAGGGQGLRAGGGAGGAGALLPAGNLSACANSRCVTPAEQVGQDVLAYRQAHGIADPWKSGQRLLVAVSPESQLGSARPLGLPARRRTPGPVARRVGRTRHAAAPGRPGCGLAPAAARELGARSPSPATRTSWPVCAWPARHNVTQLVVGKPAGWRGLDLLRGGSILNRLIRESGHRRCMPCGRRAIRRRVRVCRRLVRSPRAGGITRPRSAWWPGSPR